MSQRVDEESPNWSIEVEPPKDVVEDVKNEMEDIGEDANDDERVKNYLLDRLDNIQIKL